MEDFTEYGGGNDVYKTTYQLYHANELGMGENRDGIIILLSMDECDYAMFVYGKNAEYAFNKYGQEQLEEAVDAIRQKYGRTAIAFGNGEEGEALPEEEL